MLVIACCSTITLAIKNTATSLINSYKDAYEVEATIGFNRENMKDKFDFTNKEGMNEFYTLTTNEQEVLNATNSVNNVATFALTFLILTLVIGAIVLFVINQINIRERKYEIGVLRTIGMKKSLLTFQFIIELSIVAFIALLLGCGIGTVLSKPVGNMLLANEIENSQNSMNEINNNFGGRPNKPDINGVVNVEAFDSINAVVDYKVVLELLLIGISLTLVSSISSMISIKKFSPLQILKERS